MSADKNNYLGDLGKIAGNAFNVAKNITSEGKEFIKQQIENCLNSMNLVKREEVEVLNTMLEEMHKEISDLKERYQNLSEELDRKSSNKASDNNEE